MKRSFLVSSYSFVNFIINVDCFEDCCLNFFNIGCFLLHNYLKLLSLKHNCQKRDKKRWYIHFIFYTAVRWISQPTVVMHIKAWNFQGCYRYIFELYIKPRQSYHLMKLNFNSTVHIYMYITYTYIYIYIYMYIYIYIMNDEKLLYAT